jgi:putative flippase GtrA
MQLETVRGAVWLRSPGGRKTARYLVASLASVVVGQAVLAVAFGGLGWSAAAANLLAFAVAAVASYYLNRVWGRSGRSDMLREVVPFWGVAAVGLLVSSVMVSLVESRTAGAAISHGTRTVLVMAGAFASVGVVWFVKFLILNRFVFAHDEPA